jgi:hypothetical protein
MTCGNHKKYFFYHFFISLIVLTDLTTTFFYSLLIQLIIKSRTIKIPETILVKFAHFIPFRKLRKIKLIINLFQNQIFPINLITNNNISKFHFITSQSASFISENILYLPQFLINTNSVAFCLLLINATIHFPIPFHKNALKNLNKLKRNNQTDGDKSIVEQEVRSKRNGGSSQTINMLSIPNEHLKANLTFTPQIAKNRTAQRTQQLKHKNSNNYLID